MSPKSPKPAKTEFPMADYHFYQMGLAYYAAGRFASSAALMPVNGNLLHHAVEMILKGFLTQTLSLEQMAKNPYRHHLPSIWREFKRFHPSENLDGFDGLVDRIHEFDSIRYPDNVLKLGAVISTGFVSGNLVSGPTPAQPVYQLSVTELDELMRTLFRLCGINPEAYFGHRTMAVEAVERDNVSCQGWFRQREQARGQ